MKPQTTQSNRKKTKKSKNKKLKINIVQKSNRSTEKKMIKKMMEKDRAKMKGPGRSSNSKFQNYRRIENGYQMKEYKKHAVDKDMID